MIKGERILITGTLADLVTTLYGVTKENLIESNELGVEGVAIANTLLILVAVWTLKLDRPKWVDWCFIVTGCIRLVVGIRNLLLIV